MPTIGLEHHDHAACVRTTFNKAEAHCAATGLRLTPVRRRALEVLLAEHRALGAYGLLETLQLKALARCHQLPTAHWIFLVKAGFAHKIEALKAYSACTHLGSDHAPAFLICRSCKSVAETDTAPAQGGLGAAARDAG